MSVCPVCQYQHQEEVSKCQRCNWSMQDDLDIRLDHPILKICIPTLIKFLEDQNKALYSRILASDPHIQRENNQKLDKILDKLENQSLDKLFDRLEIELEKYIQEIKELKFLRGSKNNFPNINIEATDGSTDNESSSSESNFQLDNDCKVPVDEAEQTELLQIMDEQILRLIENYNTDKNLFKKSIIYTVIETKESQANRLAHPSEEVFFSSVSKGNYWIVEENNNFYLVPRAKININEHNKRYTIEKIFECNESISGNYDFQLIKPAKVTQLSSELWQLEEKGKLEFF